MTRKIRVGILLGGASSERQVSLASGHMIAEHLSSERYEPVLLDTLALMAHNPKLPPTMRAEALALVARQRHAGATTAALPAPRSGLPAALVDAGEAATRALPATDALDATRSGRIDVAFPALHGRYGEDGTLQGLLELLGVPYVGSGPLASALAMDKEMAKEVLAADGIPVPDGLLVHARDFDADPDGTAAAAAARFLPAVVKPSREGSSIGVHIVETASEMRPALAEAFTHDIEVVVEERAVGTEVSVGVIGNRELTVLPVIEIVSKHAFFDFAAKYDSEATEEICPARIPPPLAAHVQELAARAHRALGCRGLSRTDLILTTHGPVVLELNTLPGMTINSLLPKAAQAAGISFAELLDRLITLALEPE